MLDKVFIDTCLFIYFIERHPRFFKKIKHIFTQIDKGTKLGISSVILLHEVLVQPYRKGEISLAKKYEKILLHSKNLLIIPINTDVVRLSAKLRAKYNIPTPDAIQAAVAVLQSVDIFYTSDTIFNRIIELPKIDIIGEKEES
ncbi:PIN domain-containing protein [candidate division WOR-3 bacterium]|nr:PIN domain-containing protein [candidate division WOR-3 bacterium]